MEDEKTLYELSQDEYLRRRIKFFQNKIKELKEEIKKSESLLQTIEASNRAVISGGNYQIITFNLEHLEFSTTYWRPKVFNFLFENPSRFTTEQILVGIDTEKKYLKDTVSRNKAVKAISSSLFQLFSSKKVDKHGNDGRRGHKWSIKEPAQVKLTGAG